MSTFYKLLGYALIAGTTNNFVWFALTFWAYLMTKSVISTSFIGGFYLIAVALSGFLFGAVVDNNKKKVAMAYSSISTLILFSLGFLIFIFNPATAFETVTSPALWIFATILLAGVIAGNIINISIPTLITHLVPDERRDRANGMLGMVFGISFAITSVASGLTLAFLGMLWVLIFAVGLTLLALVYLAFIKIPENKTIHLEHDAPKRLDIRGTIKVVSGIQGLFPLILFTTFNNFLGGVFMALMDAYGLSLVPVEVWGTMWGLLSFGFILGGLFIAKRGLGKNPLATLFRVNLIMWVVSIIFTIQPSIVLLFIGSFIWITLSPFAEASEQTIIQKVVPPERQGRVFGFAQSIEQAASPLTAFMIGPIAQFIFIPFMTTGAGVELIGDWFGVGTGRGIALVFIFAGAIGFIVTLLAMRTRAYRLLSTRYLSKK